MTLRLYRYLQGFILILTAIFLLQKIFSGNLDWYIHQRFMPLTVLSVIVLLVIGVIVFRSGRSASRDEHHDHEHEHHHHEHHVSRWGLVMALVPLLVGVLIPPKPLTSDAITGKGFSSAPPVASGGSVVQFDQAFDERNILDWHRLFSSPDAQSAVLGQSANVTGFVYHDPRLKEGQFLVSRFMVICCAADGFPIGMVVNWPESASLPADQWIKVKGVVQSTQFGQQTWPLIEATSVEAIQIPDQPYLFP
jgi:uncharacterized repeat protein (TIGR03943 family)